MPIFQSTSFGPVPNSNVVEVVTTYSATTANDVIYASGSAFTITLPAVSSDTLGKVFTIEKTDSSLTNIITITGTGFSTTLNTVGESVQLCGSATGWFLNQRRIPSVWTSATITGTWVSVGGGGSATYTAFLKRIGDSATISYNVALNGAPTATGLILSLPTGIVMDTAKMVSTTLTRLGGGYVKDSGGNTYEHDADYTTNTSATLVVLDVSTYLKYGATITQVVPITFGNADSINGTIGPVPIVGWNG